MRRLGDVLTISLTSIPPRFSMLGPVLDSLLAQNVPARVLLHIPRTYRRFAYTSPAPKLPKSIELIENKADYGPATKLLGALEAGVTGDLLYCDDDCLYQPDWAEALLAARQDKRQAVAASCYCVSRHKRRPHAPYNQIAQGFAGVLVRTEMFDASVFVLPAAAYAVDDIWLSGHLAKRGTEVVCAKDARALCIPQQGQAESLQDQVIGGQSRAQANLSCLDAITARYGIWPSEA